jgi:hypothetical protein
MFHSDSGVQARRKNKGHTFLESVAFCFGVINAHWAAANAHRVTFRDPVASLFCYWRTIRFMSSNSSKP